MARGGDQLVIALAVLLLLPHGANQLHGDDPRLFLRSKSKSSMYNDPL